MRDTRSTTEQNRFISANQLMGRYVSLVRTDQWKQAVSSAPAWPVRQLVAHIADDNRWVADMLAGRTVAEVAAQFTDDPLGDTPLACWREAAESAESAVAALVDLQRVVHLSYADVTAESYLRQMVIDRVIHTWDLANAIGASTDLPDDLVAAAWEWLEPQAEDWRTAGILGPAVAPPDRADLQTKLLALAGRRIPSRVR